MQILTLWLTSCELQGKLPHLFGASAIKGENYSSLKGFCEEEWEQRCERHFVPWYLADSHSSLWGMNELCVQRDMEALAHVTDRTRAQGWCARDRSLWSQTTTSTGCHDKHLSHFISLTSQLPYGSNDFPCLSVRKMSPSRSNLAKVTKLLDVGEICQALCKI